MEQTLEVGRLHRTQDAEFAPFKREAGDDAEELFECVMSSETPVQRSFGRESLSHDRKAIDTRFLDKGMAVLVRHGVEVVGVVREWTLDEKKRQLRGKVQFSRSQRGREVRQDVEDKVLHFTSVGYDIVRAKITKDNVEHSQREVSITRWIPQELSLVAMPEDPTVGFRENQGAVHKVEIEGAEAAQEEAKMDPTTPPSNTPATTPPSPAGAPPAAGTGIEVTHQQREAIVTQEREKSAAILALCFSNGIPVDEAQKFIAQGMTREAVACEILEKRQTRGNGQPAAEVLDGLPAKDRSRYSMAKALLGCAMQREGSGKLDGLELEVHQEIAKNLPLGYTPKGGVFIPNRVGMRRELTPQMVRTLDSKTLGAGAETVFDQPGEMIELLRNRSVVASMGARIMPGLTAPIPMVKHTGAAIARWVGETPGAGVAASQVAFGLVTIQPKTLQATTGYSRQYLALASIDVEAFVRDDFGLIHGLAIDLAALHGKGVNGEPAGLYITPDVQSTSSFGVPTYAKMVASVAKVAKKNALRNALGWVTTPEYAAVAAVTPVISGAAAGFVWNGTVMDGTMAGYRAMSSNQVSALMNVNEPDGGTSHGLLFGNWADLLVGLFGAMEVIADPYTLADQALIKITSFQMADVVVRHGESFFKATGATLT